MVARRDASGRWIERMDYSFFKKEIHGLQIFSIELIFPLDVRNSFTSWARRGGYTWLVVTSCTLRL